MTDPDRSTTIVTVNTLLFGTSEGKEATEMRGSNSSPAIKLSRAALAFRAAHTAIAAEQLFAIAYVWWCALTGRRGHLLRITAASLIGEGVLVTANHGDCPLGPLQQRLGDPVPLFELVLSPSVAKRAVPALGAIAAAGLALLMARACRDFCYREVRGKLLHHSDFQTLCTKSRASIPAYSTRHNCQLGLPVRS